MNDIIFCYMAKAKIYRINRYNTTFQVVLKITV